LRRGTSNLPLVRPEGFVEIVADDGEGMPEEVLLQAFTPSMPLCAGARTEAGRLTFFNSHGYFRKGTIGSSMRLTIARAGKQAGSVVVRPKQARFTIEVRRPTRVACWL
jgi:hypothetical protein